MSVSESLGYRAIIVVSQHVFWLLAQLLRVAYAISVHRPAGLFESRSECCLVLASTHRTLLDPWLLMGSLPYRAVRALIPVRPLATQTFSGLLLVFKPLIKVVYWVGGVIQLPPEDDGDESLPEKLRGLSERLRDGDVVMIFPEGERWRKRKPSLGEFAPGVVYLQRALGAPIVPIAVWMSERWQPRRRYVIRFGQPVQIPEQLDLDAGAEWLRQHTLKLFEQAKGELER